MTDFIQLVNVGIILRLPWQNKWVDLSTYKYPPELRKLIYTANAIENFNRQLSSEK